MNAIKPAAIDPARIAHRVLQPGFLKSYTLAQIGPHLKHP